MNSKARFLASLALSGSLPSPRGAAVYRSLEERRVRRSGLAKLSPTKS